MLGGTGNDLYVVDSGADLVDETAGNGTDTVTSTISFSLSSASQVKGLVENLTLLGTGAIQATGNALANLITGNSGNNVLAGLAGADTLDGGAGLDTASYAASASGVTVSLLTGLGSGGDAEGDTLINLEHLIGSNFNDTLEGNSGNNVLNGGLGIDTVSYAAATAGVTVNLGISTAQNTSAAGMDQLQDLENLIGSAFDDVLTGSASANAIYGGDGNDTINGGAGHDTLTGGPGADAFVFNSTLGASNVDRLVDFTAADDIILLENTGIFTALTTTGQLNPNAFRIGSVALDADDRILYDALAGQLLYDADGSGAKLAIQFASIDAGLSMTSTNFLVI